MHIKTIKGKKYYYESKRIGHKVTSIYIGPVAGVQSHKKAEEDVEDVSNQTDDEFYVG